MIREWTAEHPASGLVVHQPAQGFRYSADAFWLAGFALEPGVPSTSLDLGTGSGIVAFLLARAGADATGLDIHPAWLDGWHRSLLASAHRPMFWHLDVRALRTAATFELVTCNPPFARAGDGPAPADPLRAAAHVESGATLADFVDAAARAVAPTGRVAFIVPGPRSIELLGYARKHGLGLVRRVMIGPRVLLDLRPGGTLVEDVLLDRQDPRVLAFFPERA